MPHQGQQGVYFESGGHRLLGSLFLARGDEPKPTAILLHGVPGIEKNVDLAHRFRANGWNCLIFHYRGCWGSEGNYTFRTIPQDVLAAFDYLVSGIIPQVDPSRIVLIGHSLGGWAATLVSARDLRIQAIVLIAPIAEPSALHYNEQDAQAKFTPWLTGISPADFVRQWQALAGLPSPTQVIAQISPRPVLILHGRMDELIPFSQSEVLYRSAKQPCNFLAHDQANHSFAWYREWLISTILNWLDRLYAKPLVSR